MRRQKFITTTNTTTTILASQSNPEKQQLLRVKIRLGSMQSEAKLLRFSPEETTIEALGQKIAAKLGLPPPLSPPVLDTDGTMSTTTSSSSSSSASSSFKLYLGGEALVEDTSEIDDLDDLVLVVVAAPERNKGRTTTTATEKEEKDDDEYVAVDNDDSDSVEDVTNQVVHQKQQQRRAAAAAPIDIFSSASSSSTSDDDGDDDGDEDNDEDYENEDVDDEEDHDSHADDLSYGGDDDGDIGDDSSIADSAKVADRRRRTTAKRSRCCHHQPKDPPLEVLMDSRDVPVAPGKQRNKHLDDTIPEEAEDDYGMLETSTLSGSATAADVDTKNRIMKLLNTGFHPNSNEHEAKNAMKLAQRLMRKHNLSQAVLLREREGSNNCGDDDDVLQGGLVEVQIVNRQTRKPSPFSRWLSALVTPVAHNFDVEACYSVARGRRCAVTFYGIYTNCQLAAYAYRVAVERISQMAAVYHPAEKKKKQLQQQHSNSNPWSSSGSSRSTITTKSSRLCYALGIVRGIQDEVVASLQREQEQRERRLRARMASAKGEAYEESDRDDADDEEQEEEENRDSDDADDGCGFDMARYDDHDRKPAASTTIASSTTTHSLLSGEALQRRLQTLEDENQSALVLVHHREKVAERVLAERNIKVRKGRKWQPIITFDRTSYEKGVEDAREIDINQRAIRDKVKVKREKRDR